MGPRCQWPCPNGFWGPGCQQRIGGHHNNKLSKVGNLIFLFDYKIYNNEGQKWGKCREWK